MKPNETVGRFERIDGCAHLRFGIEKNGYYFTVHLKGSNLEGIEVTADLDVSPSIGL